MNSKHKKQSQKNKKQQLGSKKNKVSKLAKSKGKYIDYKEKFKKGDPLPKFDDDAIRLNKFIANAGICSRREADVLIEAGVVTVNDQVVTELGYKVKSSDTIKYDDETIKAGIKRYVLINKPAGFTTISNSPSTIKKTAFYLLRKACKETILPVDKLEKEATGLILFSNDIDLMKKLLHSKSRAKQIYELELNRPITKEDVTLLQKGVTLEDGTTNIEDIQFLKDGYRKIGIEIHSGKKQIVHRLFDAVGYKIDKLDRVSYAGLSKKDLPRGYYRHLTEQEIAFLKMSK